MSLSVPLLLPADRWGHRDHGAGLGPTALQLTSRMQPAVKPVLVNLTCPCCNVPLQPHAPGKMCLTGGTLRTCIDQSSSMTHGLAVEVALRAQLTTCPWALARHRTSPAVHSNVLCYPKVCVRLALCQRPLAGKFQFDD